MKGRASTILRILWCALVFFLPLRWNYAAISVEQANYPMDAWEWLFFTIQPHFLLAAISGALLLLTAAIHPAKPGRDASFAVPAVAFSPVLLGLAGLVNTTETAYAQAWFWHFYTVACISLGVWWTSRHDERLLPWMLHTVAAGALIAILQGWHQHFGGLQAEYEAQLEHAKNTGTALSEQMLAKLRQTRSTGSFADPNAYAAQLLLASPFFVLEAVRLGRRTSTPRAGGWILGGAACILAVGALVFSGSRGGVLGAVAGVAIAALLLLEHRLTTLWKAGLVLAAILLASAMVFALNYLSKRKMETVTVRLEYYRTAVEIYRGHPVFGAGLGEFYPWHMRLKGWEGDDARDAHSVFFAQLSQCGIPGALDALIRLSLPFLLAAGLFRRRRCKSQALFAMTVCGMVAWNVHALTQFNDMIVSTTSLAGFLGLYAFGPTRREEAATAGRSPRPLSAYLPMGALVLLGLGCIWSLHQAPGARAHQLAEDSLADRYLSYQRRKALLLDAISRDSTAFQPPKLLADMAVSRGDLETARLAVDELLRRTPHRATAHWRAWKLAVASGDAEGEAKALEAVARWNPTDLSLWLLRGVSAAHPSLTGQEKLLVEGLQLEKHEVTEESVRIGVAFPNPQVRRLAEPLLATLLDKGFVEELSGRRLVFTLEEQEEL